MNYEIKKSSIRGAEEVNMIVWPSDSLETEFFSRLFGSGEVELHLLPNSDQVIIKRKPPIEKEDTD